MKYHFDIQYDGNISCQLLAKRITLYQEVLFCSLVFLPQGICQTAPQRSKIWDTLQWQLLGYYQGMGYLVTIIIT